MSKHGLTTEHQQIIASILGPYRDKIDSVNLFGSRATGKYRENSDIDIVIYGCITNSDLEHISTGFEESLLPYKVDVLAYHLIDYPALKHHIDIVSSPFLRKADLKHAKAQ